MNIPGPVQAFHGGRWEMPKKNEKFVRLSYDLLDSEEWWLASRTERDIYISMCAKRWRKDFRGRQECIRLDYIPFGYSDMLTKCSAESFVRGVERLRTLKLIKLIEAGSFQPKKKAVYALGIYRS